MDATITTLSQSQGEALQAFEAYVGQAAISDGYTGDIVSASLDNLLARAAGPGSNDAAHDLLDAYAQVRASAGLIGPPGLADSLRAALFEADGTTPRVDGGGLALAQRLRQRPETLFAEWDNVIAEHVVALGNNPLYSSNTSASNPLYGLSQRASNVEGAVNTLSSRLDEQAGITTKLDGRVTDVTAQTLAIDAKMVELCKQVDGQTQQVGELGGAYTALDLEVSALASDMAAGDALLSEQLYQREGDLCVLSGMLRADHTGDEGAWEASDADLSDRQDGYCGATGHLERSRRFKHLDREQRLQVVPDRLDRPDLPQPCSGRAYVSRRDKSGSFQAPALSRTSLIRNVQDRRVL